MQIERITLATASERRAAPAARAAAPVGDGPAERVRRLAEMIACARERMQVFGRGRAGITADRADGTACARDLGGCVFPTADPVGRSRGNGSGSRPRTGR